MAPQAGKAAPARAAAITILRGARIGGSPPSTQVRRRKVADRREVEI
jgi:hypothetical protein